MRRTFLTIIVTLLCLAARLFPQEPRVLALEATAEHGKLAVSVRSADLFAPKIANTIRSGLPAIIRYDFRFIKDPGKEVSKHVHLVKVVYDIWSQRFEITSGDSVRHTATFDQMEELGNHLRIANFSPPPKPDSSAWYRLRVQINVLPIRTHQNKELRALIESAQSAGDGAATESGGSGFSINISRLLTFFLGGKQSSHGSSEWVSSEPFRLSTNRNQRR